MHLHDGNLANNALSILEGMMASPQARTEIANAEAPSVDRAGHKVQYMDPADTLPDISHIDVGAVFGISESKEEEVQEISEEVVETSKEKTVTLTESELQTLLAAKDIIDRLTEATTVGCLGVNMAGPQEAPVATKVDKKKKKKKPEVRKDTNSFPSYLGKVK